MTKSSKRIAQLYFVLGLLLFCAHTGGASEMTMTIVSFSGKVEIQGSPGVAWKEAAAGDRLGAGASIRTGANASCVLGWNSGSSVKMTPLTTLKITELTAETGDRETTRMEIPAGRIVARVTKPAGKGSQFIVRTPTATAAVRGTDFLVDVARDGASVFGVTEGEIAVRIGEVEITIPRDFQLEVDSAGRFTAPEPLPEPLKEDIRKEFKDMTSAAPPDSDTGTTSETAGAGSPDAGITDAAAAAGNATNELDNVLNAVNTQSVVDTAGETIRMGTVNLEFNFGQQ